MQIVILAGGLATRLRPVTAGIPKSMVSIFSKPFLEYQIDLLKYNGISNIVLCVGFLGDQIEKYFADGKRFGVNLTYSYEKQLLGTYGAIKNAMPYLEDQFFVMYGDSYLPTDFKRIYQFSLQQQASMCMAVYRNESRYDISNVVFRNNHVIIYDKKKPLNEMQYIDYGLAVMSKKNLYSVQAGEFCDLAEVYSQLASKNQLWGYEVSDRFYEIGSFSGINDFENYIKEGGFYDYYANSI